MKSIHTKTKFPKAKGKTRYKWPEATQTFTISKSGYYAIAITAACKKDDDLRTIINHYALGKYELHQNKVSWKGFNTSAAWDGNSLKEAEKTVYIFVELQKDKDLLIEFVADGNPVIKKIGVIQLNQGGNFKLKNVAPKKPIQTDKKGIPLVSFIALGTKFKTFSFTTNCNSAKQNRGTDGDNIKVLKNGKILQNKQAPNSRKYKNFLVCGDQTQGKKTTIDIPLKNFDLIENAIELWYDQEPKINTLEIEIYKQNEEPITPKKYWYDKKIIQRIVTQGIIAWFTFRDRKYSKQFLKNARKKYPNNIVLGSRSNMAKMIKKSEAMSQIKRILKKELKRNVKEGDVRLGKPGPEVVFKEGDLFFALHGLRKLHYKTVKTEKNKTTLEVTLMDTYDFKRIEPTVKKEMSRLTIFGNNVLDRAELSRVMNNFEITVSLRITITHL